MYRCLAVLATSVVLSAPAAAQVQRGFPQDALRGVITFGTPPLIQLNGKPAQLSPGSRIRGQDNMLQMSASLVNVKAIVHYTVEPGGLVHEVWILRKDEVARKPWPETRAQAQAWQFDPIAQTWTKP